MDIEYGTIDYDDEEHAAVHLSKDELPVFKAIMRLYDLDVGDRLSSRRLEATPSMYADVTHIFSTEGAEVLEGENVGGVSNAEAVKLLDKLSQKMAAELHREGLAEQAASIIEDRVGDHVDLDVEQVE
jgi:hypothetical protein